MILYAILHYLQRITYGNFWPVSNISTRPAAFFYSDSGMYKTFQCCTKFKRCLKAKPCSLIISALVWGTHASVPS